MLQGPRITSLEAKDRVSVSAKVVESWSASRVDREGEHLFFGFRLQAAELPGEF